MNFSGRAEVGYESIIFVIKKAGLIFKGHTEQGEVDFILLDTYENGNKTSVDVVQER